MSIIDCIDTVQIFMSKHIELAKDYEDNFIEYRKDSGLVYKQKFFEADFKQLRLIIFKLSLKVHSYYECFRRDFEHLDNLLKELETKPV